MKPFLGAVKWLDASRTDDEVNPLTLTGISRETIGWVLRDDAVGVVIAMTHDDERYERGFFIPRGYIQTVVRLSRRKA